MTCTDTRTPRREQGRRAGPLSGARRLFISLDLIRAALQA